jgi:hypothetical protein
MAALAHSQSPDPLFTSLERDIQQPQNAQKMLRAEAAGKAKEN